MEGQFSKSETKSKKGFVNKTVRTAHCIPDTQR